VTAKRRVEPASEPIVLRLFGPCDAVTQTGLLMQLRRAAAAAQGRHLVVDLSDVPFMDAAGLAALIEVRALTRNRLTVQNPPWSLRRILSALNLTGQFTLVDRRMSEAGEMTDQIA
jgi:anti-anti-sigma factor